MAKTHSCRYPSACNTGSQKCLIICWMTAEVVDAAHLVHAGVEKGTSETVKPMCLGSKASLACAPTLHLHTCRHACTVAHLQHHHISRLDAVGRHVDVAVPCTAYATITRATKPCSSFLCVPAGSGIADQLQPATAPFSDLASLASVNQASAAHPISTPSNTPAAAMRALAQVLRAPTPPPVIPLFQPPAAPKPAPQPPQPPSSPQPPPTVAPPPALPTPPITPSPPSSSTPPTPEPPDLPAAPVTQTSCEDSQAYCEVFALAGYCQRPLNAGWMAANCAQSCRSCGALACYSSE